MELLKKKNSNLFIYLLFFLKPTQMRRCNLAFMFHFVVKS